MKLNSFTKKNYKRLKKKTAKNLKEFSNLTLAEWKVINEEKCVVNSGSSDSKNFRVSSVNKKKFP